MIEYQKIMAPWVRHTEGPNRNRMIPWAWTHPALQALNHIEWTWTEKIDGTNIRVEWDGHKVRFGGRTDNAQIPTILLDYLQDTFTEEILEQVFHDTEVVLFGEGFGRKIQNGGSYMDSLTGHVAFALFDVKIGSFWLEDDSVNEIATNLGILTVPSTGFDTLHDRIQALRNQEFFSAFNPSLVAEGMVGKPVVQLFDRQGHRIMVKLKYKDLAQAIN